jgi:molybdopterin-containing oxidoreductase family iron-sulfur binding subunit
MENQSKGGFTRRGFLKIVGASAAVGATACAPNKEEHLIPRVRSDARQIPGSPIWYATTCTECSAGCGVLAKSLDGRVIKVEGNPLATVNGHFLGRKHGVASDAGEGERRAGLCALGHSALQNLYDPDRIREPLRRNPDTSASGASKFIPVKWGEALGEVATALSKHGKDNLFLTGELTGAKRKLIQAWGQRAAIQHVTYDLMQPEGLVRASEAVFGIAKVPEFHFDRADVIVSFGCDFLETWISPVEYARDWASRRNEKNPAVFYQVEPRLSTTGAKSDLWLKCQPGGELPIARFILKSVLSEGKGKHLSADIHKQISALVEHANIDDVERVSGVAKSKILLLVDALRRAKTSLIVAGFEGTATSTGYDLQVLVQLLNLVLGNVASNAGEAERATITFDRTRTVDTSYAKVRKAIGSLEAGGVNVAMVYGSNPVFSLPTSLGVSEALRKAELVVAFASHFNETVAQADIILPVHTALEEWSDSEPQTGSYGLIQPAMMPIFDTRPIGNLLLLLSEKSGTPLYTPAEKETNDFYSYLRTEWRARAEAKGWLRGAGLDFETFWRKAVEDGGVFTDEREDIRLGYIHSAVFKAAKHGDTGHAVPRFSQRGLSSEGPVLFPFVHLKGYDGRAANRAWLQELPDPIAQIVWDTWAEIHPDTANGLKLSHGEPTTVRTHYGEITIPLRVTDLVAPGIIAVPIGQGHTSAGRYADAVGGGNVITLLPAIDEEDGWLPVASTRVDIVKARGAYPLVSVQGDDSQHGRDLARTRFVQSGAAHVGGSHGEHHAGGHGGHHEPKQMYKQRVHPLYEWGMTVDLAACTGCSSCIVACYSENNIPVVGKKMVEKGREMAWLRIERYIDSGPDDDLKVSFLPMMCQHCHNAPCEPVCPVFATYHNEEGMNVMVYNRCVGTRYCSNNCSYKVRRFNWVDFEFPEPLNWQLNPMVTKRGMGVMEKCTFCVQRIVEAKDSAKDQGRIVGDGEITPACVQTCPTEALVFGNLNDPDSRVSRTQKEDRAYKVLDHHLNTQPAVSYLENIKFNA